MATWVKVNNLMGIALCAWLLTLAPTGKLAKILGHIFAIASCIQAIKESEQLIRQETQGRITKTMQECLQDEVASLEYESQLVALRESYGHLQPVYSPEVMEDLIESLEANYSSSVGEDSHELTTSTYSQLKLAVRELIESGKSETWIVENVLKMGGRKFKQGKELLQGLLREDDERK